jgi:hypothetical protein
LLGPMGGGWIPQPCGLVARFYYDALDRRIRATYFDGNENIATNTLYYYDGQRVLAEFDYDPDAAPEPVQTLLRYFVDGPMYVNEHVLMCDAYCFVGHRLWS